MVFYNRRVRLNVAIGLAFVLVLLLTLVLGFTSARHVTKLLEGVETHAGSIRMLELVVELDGFDADGETMTLDWQVIDRQCILQSSTCTDVMLFFDSNQLVGSKTNTLLTEPTFYFNASAYNETVFTHFNAVPSNLPALQSSAGQKSPLFKTSVVLQTRRNREQYPFDSFFVYVTLHALEVSTNQTVSLKIDHGVGVAVGYKLSAVHLNNNNPEELHLSILFNIDRWRMLILYAMTVVVAIWMISLVFLALTIKTVLFRYPQRGEALLAPAASLFAFTSLRGTMPGAPPFGILIDYFASLPCLAILAFSAAFTAGVYIFCDPTTTATSVTNPTPREIAAQRYTETLFAGGEAIAYHAEASATAAASHNSSEQAWRAESAKHKAVAAALSAVAAANKTVDAAADVTRSVNAKTWRNELKVAEGKIVAAAWLSTRNVVKEGGNVDAQGAVEAAADVADAARDIIDVAQRAAAGAVEFIARSTGGEERQSDSDV